MNHFHDSPLFKIDSDGRVCHRREGGSWADKVLDGVGLDKTMYWENCGYSYIEEEEGDEIVGERKISEEVQETTKKWGKERGEGKFKRMKKIPQKKDKKYPTKPKPKHSWHKRLSKVACELGDVNMETEQKANGEWNDFWDEKKLEEEKKEQDYWDSWVQEVKENPGNYAVISVKILVDEDGVSVHDIDAAGVKRCNQRDPYTIEGIWNIVMDEWDKLPSTVGGSVCETDTFVRVADGFSFKTYNFFTYWDEENDMYIWKSMNKHSWMCGGWREHFDYYPNMDKLRDIFCLDKQFLPWKEVGKLTKWINGIEWSTIWSRMDEIRTGVRYGRENEYIGGDGFMNRSREANYYLKTQIPRMEFH